jgi:hypothetical protein
MNGWQICLSCSMFNRQARSHVHVGVALEPKIRFVQPKFMLDGLGIGSDVRASSLAQRSIDRSITHGPYVHPPVGRRGNRAIEPDGFAPSTSLPKKSLASRRIASMSTEICTCTIGYYRTHRASKNFEHTTRALRSERRVFLCTRSTPRCTAATTLPQATVASPSRRLRPRKASMTARPGRPHHRLRAPIHCWKLVVGFSLCLI